MRTTSIYALIALSLFAVACGGGRVTPKSLPPAEPALTANAVTAKAADLKSAVKLGETRTLGTFRVTVTTVAIRSLVQDFKAPAVEAAYPHVVIEVRIDNPSKTAISRPDVRLIDPSGHEYGFYGGVYNGPTNLADIDAVPPGTTLAAAVYIRFGGGGEHGDPPASFEGWTVKVDATDGVAAGTSAIWLAG